MTEYTIYIKLTNNCNLQCKHCYNSIMKNNYTMSNDTLKNVNKYIIDFKNKHEKDIINIIFHGGEPLLYDIDSIIDFIKTLNNINNIKFGITTNLMYKLTDKHFELFNLIKPFGNPFIQTSWDYKIRFNSNQKNIWENNIKQLIKNNIIIQPTICLTNILINNIKPIDLFKYFIDLNIKNLNFERITNTGRAVINNLRPKNKDMNLWLLDAYKLYKDLNIKIPLFESIEYSFKKIYLGCRARKCMSTVITINPDGTIASCPNMANKTYGNLNETDIKKQEDLIKFEKNINEKCLLCEFYTFCNGDCCQLEFDSTGCPGLIEIYKHLKYN